MLTKSLVIFIGVGVVSGLVFGAFLYDLKNSSQPVFVEGPSLSVLTDKSAYKQGETIQVRIMNSGTTHLKFSDATFGFKITGLSGFVIYGHGNGGDDDSDNRSDAGNGSTEQILKPGQQIIFSWNMLKTDGTPVLAGVYKIHTAATAVDINTYNNNNNNNNVTSTDPDPISASTTITIT